MNSDAAVNNSKRFAMIPNGDWLATEAKGANTDPIVMMSVPVISSIITQCASIENDAELSALITAIDNGETALSGTGYDVTQKDYDRIAEARNIVYSQSSNHIAYSPAYANAKTLIKKFFLFIASDEGIEIYQENVNPGIMPFDYDYKADNSFVASILNLYKKNYISTNPTSLLSLSGGVKAMRTNSGYYEALLGAPKTSKNYMSAQQIFESEFESDELFEMTLRNLGLIK